MSDGPYRSLPMSRSWKRLAEFAENVNFGDADLCAAAKDALERTWRSSVPDGFMESVRKVFLTPQFGLFADQRLGEIEALSTLAAGHGIGRLLLDHAACVTQEGSFGEPALIEATQRTLTACGARASRSIDEHYMRKASGVLARQVRERVWQALSAADRRALARQLCGLDAGPGRRRSLKHQGIDDGVAL
jgi:hypothetical protein